MAKNGRAEACAHVYRKFPALDGVRPSAASAGRGNRVYTFDKRVSTGRGGPKMRQVVRVTVDESGRIVKVVASR